jgi:hypothetical protein
MINQQYPYDVRVLLIGLPYPFPGSVPMKNVH